MRDHRVLFRAQYSWCNSSTLLYGISNWIATSMGRFLCSNNHNACVSLDLLHKSVSPALPSILP